MNAPLAAGGVADLAPVLRLLAETPTIQCEAEHSIADKVHRNVQQGRTPVLHVPGRSRVQLLFLDAGSPQVAVLGYRLRAEALGDTIPSRRPGRAQAAIELVGRNLEKLLP